MPTFMAMVISATAGWFLDAPLRAVLGLGGSLVVNFVVTSLIFIFAKRFLIQMRDGA